MFDLGGILSMAGSLGSGLLGSASSSREGRRNRRFMKYQMRNQYQLMAQDLEDAGLNKILAVNKGATSPSSPGTHGFNYDNPVSAYMEYKQAKQQLSLTDALEAKARAETATAKTLANKYSVDARESESRIPANVVTAKQMNLDLVQNQAYWDTVKYTFGITGAAAMKNLPNWMKGALEFIGVGTNAGANEIIQGIKTLEDKGVIKLEKGKLLHRGNQYIKDVERKRDLDKTKGFKR